MTGGQGAAGSNPAVPTSNQAFSNIVTPHNSQLVVPRPLLQARADQVHGHLTGRCQHGRTGQGPQTRSQRSPSRPNLHRDPANATRPAPSAPTGGTAPAGRGHTTAPEPGPAHAAADARPPPHGKPPLRTGRHDCSDLHRPPAHRPHPRYGESAAQVSSQCDARTNEFPDFKAGGTAHDFP